MLGFLILTLALCAYCYYLIRQQKSNNAKIYAEQERKHAEWREEALKRGKQAIFSDEDRKDVERILKGEGLNRKQRRGKAKKFEKDFVGRVKEGLE
jgi:hypothetical protein